MDLLPCPFCSETTKLEVDYDDGPQNPFPGHRVLCRTCGGTGPAADARSDDVSCEQAIANWNRRPTSTLTGVITMDEAAVGVSSGTGMALPDARTVSDRRIAEWRAAGVAMIDGDKMGGKWTGDAGDDLAQAREKRDLAGLPSIETAAEPDGVSMDFDLGGDKSRKK